MKNQMEKVIIKEEKNPYLTEKCYIAVFPEEKSNVNMLTCIPFHFINNIAIFESICECSLLYYYSTKIIHKNTETAQKCLQAVNNYYNTTFKLAEKL